MSNSEREKKEHGSLLTVKQFAEKHSWPVGGLRHLLFYRPKGFEKVIYRVGRKILISEAQFFNWIEETNRARGA